MHSAAIVMKECDAYGEITVTGTDHIYATPHVDTTPQWIDNNNFYLEFVSFLYFKQFLCTYFP